MSRTLSIRVLAEVFGNSVDPDDVLDSNGLGGLQLQATGNWKSKTAKDIIVSPADEDVAVPWTNDLVALILLSEQPFKVRPASGETQVTTRAYVLVGDGTTAVRSGPGSVLLDGNGSNEARVEAWIIEAAS